MWQEYCHLKVHDLVASPRAANHHDGFCQQDDDKRRHREYLPAIMEHGLRNGAWVSNQACHAPQCARQGSQPVNKVSMSA